MFYENSITSEFSFEGNLPASTTESETRHLINRLRLEFRTASQRQLEDSVSTAQKSASTCAGEKVFQLAKVSLQELLTPQIDREYATPESTEPPFRTPVS